MKRARRTVVPILFAMYQKLGKNRSLKELSGISGVELPILEAYADAGDWELRLKTDFAQGADSESDRELSKQIDALQRKLFGKIFDAIGLMDNCSIGLPFDIQSAKEFSLLAKAYETMVKASILAKTAFVPLDEELPTTWLDLVREVYKDEPE